MDKICAMPVGCRIRNCGLQTEVKVWDSPFLLKCTLDEFHCYPTKLSGLPALIPAVFSLSTAPQIVLVAHSSIDST